MLRGSSAGLLGRLAGGVIAALSPSALSVALSAMVRGSRLAYLAATVCALGGLIYEVGALVALFGIRGNPERVDGLVVYWTLLSGASASASRAFVARVHPRDIAGTLQADGYAGLEQLHGERIQEAAWSAPHAWRKFFDVHVALDSPIAKEALERIGQLYAIEAEICGRPPDERRAVRRTRTGPELESLHGWLHQQLAKLPKKSELANAIRYSLSGWTALTRYRDDARIEIDNNAAERAAAVYSLFGTAQLNGLNVEPYLRLVLARLPEHPINRVADLLPWDVANELRPAQLAAA